MESLVLLFLNSWRAVGAGGVMYGGVRGREVKSPVVVSNNDNGKEEVVVAIAVVQTSDVAG
ncbi:unnamed protein product [Brugia pahangi]|uniref:Secreted protein n=1 Tax=Brugia pahangi TaxID=6280 RepID=A0A0N4TP53_BRUPA|nr:unnamed protein product [Brugia pahangi]